MNTLLSRLPDRCAFCHREIVDEGGLFHAEGIYHAACSDKLESLEGLRREAVVPFSEAVQFPKRDLLSRSENTESRRDI
jgi:hypothetical protein